MSAKAFNRSEHATKWIPVKDISVVWAAAQRGLNEREAKRIADEFDPDAFGVISVSLPNGAGHYHCIDGQTRVTAVKMLWGEKESVPCNVIQAEEPAIAAEIFLKMNAGRNRPGALDLFKVGVAAGRKTEVAVDKLIGGLGYRIGMDYQDGTISAVSALKLVYTRYGAEVLKDTLLVIQGTWGRDRDSTTGAIIQGYARLLNEHGSSVDRQKLVNKIAKKMTPGNLLARARAAREMFGGSLSENVVRVLVTTYDYGLKHGRLSGDDDS